MKGRMMEHFDSLQGFVQVVDMGSFAGAARQLGLTTSAVSKRVTQLEEVLGVQLLHRTTRRVGVTDLGSLYYERAVEILTLVEEAAGAVQESRISPTGALRISSPTSFGVIHLAPAICEFHEHYPKLKIEIILNDRIVNPIEEGFDVSLQDAGLRPGSMVERRLFPFRRVVCASPQYLAAHGMPRHPRDLAKHACIQYSYHESGNVWRFESPEGPLSVTIDPLFSTNNGRIMLDAALQEKGITVLPTFLAAPHLIQGALVALLTHFPFASLYLSAVYPRRKHLAYKVKLLLDFLAARFGPEPPWDRQLEPLLTPAP